MKFDASVRHSGGYFFDVKPMITGIPLSRSQLARSEVVQKHTDPMRQKLSRKPISVVTSLGDHEYKWRTPINEPYRIDDLQQFHSDIS